MKYAQPSKEPVKAPLGEPTERKPYRLRMNHPFLLVSPIMQIHPLNEGLRDIVQNAPKDMGSNSRYLYVTTCEQDVGFSM